PAPTLIPAAPAPAALVPFAPVAIPPPAPVAPAVPVSQPPAPQPVIKPAEPKLEETNFFVRKDQAKSPAQTAPVRPPVQQAQPSAPPRPVTPPPAPAPPAPPAAEFEKPVVTEFQPPSAPSTDFKSRYATPQ